MLGTNTLPSVGVGNWDAHGGGLGGAGAGEVSEAANGALRRAAVPTHAQIKIRIINDRTAPVPHYTRDLGT